MDITDSRKKIDEIDEALSMLFIERMSLAADISEYKLTRGVNIRDAAREQEIVKKLLSKSENIYAPYLKALYSQIFEMSRAFQSHLQLVSSIEYGLVGEDVSNSYSKWIHQGIGNRNYGLYSFSGEMFSLMLKKRAFKGICVDAPYYNDAVGFCDRLDEVSAKTGCVNTIVKEADGTFSGYNTYCVGFSLAAEKAKLDFNNKKIMILGNGCISASVQEALKDKNAAEILVVTRTGKINFRNYTQYSDVEIIINATNIGMAPDTDSCPVNISLFKKLSAVIDFVYAPVETHMIKEAKKRNIPILDGLKIMISHNAVSSSLFGFKANDAICEELYSELLSFIE